MTREEFQKTLNQERESFRRELATRPAARAEYDNVVQIALTLTAAFGLAAWVYFMAARGNFWREFERREPNGLVPVIS